MNYLGLISSVHLGVLKLGFLQESTFKGYFGGIASLTCDFSHLKF